MKKHKLKEIIADYHSRDQDHIIARDLKIPVHTNKIVTLTGARRSGKTFLLFDLIARLLEQNTPKEHILYLNFEDERLEGENILLDDILQAYQELYPKITLKSCYFFFDEIQNIPNWEKMIRRFHDTITKNIFLTGSNSHLLSRDIATALRGRTLTFEVFPLSFSEFMRFNKINIKDVSSKNKAKTARAFSTFLLQGGFPETIFLPQELHQNLLQDYFNTMIFRDLVERYEISQTTVLKYFCKRLISNSAGEFSTHKVFNELKSQGYKIGKNTMYQFQDHTEAIYLSLFLQRHDESLVKREQSQKKSYAIDTGLANALDFKFSKDQGKQLETAVFLELIKQGKSLFYYKNGFECDFLVQDRGQVTTALQVSFTMDSQETKRREINGLTSACKQFGLSEGHIITADSAEEIEVDGIHIHIIPAYQYFLDAR